MIYDLQEKQNNATMKNRSIAAIDDGPTSTD